MGSLSIMVVKTFASFLWQLLLAFFKAYARQMTLPGRFLSSEFKWAYCLSTGMIVDAGASGFSLERVPITIRPLCWHLSCS